MPTVARMRFAAAPEHSGHDTDESAHACASQSDRALSLIRRHVLMGTFGPGHRLSEPRLSALLGLSRTPIRAALRQLEFEGLLTPHAGGGLVVREHSPTEIEDVIEMRAALEGLAVQRALQRGISRTLLIRAREMLMCIDAVLSRPQLDHDSVGIYAERNRAFHALLAEMSGSAVIQQQLDLLTRSPFGDPAAFVFARAAMPDAHVAFCLAHEHHRQIVDALNRNESHRAVALLNEHSHSGRRALQHAVATRRTDLIHGGQLIARPRLM